MQKEQENQQNQSENETNPRRMGCWSSEEQTKYIQFLRTNRKLLQSRQQRKNSKIFKLMADFIGSRDGIQCRSHHIKQIRTHRQIRKIIDFYSGCKQYPKSPKLPLKNFLHKKKEAQPSTESVLNPRTQFLEDEVPKQPLQPDLGYFWPPLPLYMPIENNYHCFSQIRFDYPQFVPIVFITGTLPTQMLNTQM